MEGSRQTIWGSLLLVCLRGIFGFTFLGQPASRSRLAFNCCFYILPYHQFKVESDLRVFNFVCCKRELTVNFIQQIEKLVTTLKDHGTSRPFTVANAKEYASTHNCYTFSDDG